MQTCTFLVKLHLAAPVLSQLSGGRAYGLDTAALRCQQQLPALPGSLIRGNLRHVWAYFVNHFADGLDGLNPQGINTWLGEPSPAGTQDEPKRARLHFSYYWQAQSNPESTRVRHRIAIDKASGTVATGALQVIEEPFAFGEQVCFSGTIRAYVADEQEAKQLKHWLRKGLEYIPALGALKGSGFGRLVKVELEQLQAEQRPNKQKFSSATIGLRLQFDRPICCARHHNADNRFEAEDFIPGGAIRGVIAQAVLECAEYPKLSQYLDKIYIKHALPVARPVEKRPLAIPLSFVSAPQASNSQDTTIYDLSAQATAGLIYHRAPTFQPDWKGSAWAQAAQICGHSAPPERHIQVRTAIDPITGTTQEHALFAVETVDTEDHDWLTEVNCHQLPEADRQAVLQELATLFTQGLPGLGKTKAWVTGQCLAQPYPGAVATGGLEGDRLVLILQTAALLLPHPYGILATQGGEQLQQRYAEVWARLSEQSLELLYFYAQQGLVGGHYLWQRFWQSVTEHYNPQLLTLAGSVFVFKLKHKEKARALITAWVRDGLPQLPEASEDWRHNPYIAANGYGEILINPNWDHLKPPREAWHEL